MLFQDANDGSSSALLKLYDNHSCDSFLNKDREKLSAAELALQRKITQDSVQGLKETIARVVSFQHMISSSSASQGSYQLAPWIAHCFYRSSVAFTWIGSAVSLQDGSEFFAKKLLCINGLTNLGTRWKIARKLAPTDT